MNIEGTGSSVSYSYTCSCIDKYTGTNCEFPGLKSSIQSYNTSDVLLKSSVTSEPISNPCLSNPCQNGGTCYMPKSNEYTCSCPTNFYGPNCGYYNQQIVNSPCTPNPCQNGIFIYINNIYILCNFNILYTNRNKY